MSEVMQDSHTLISYYVYEYPNFINNNHEVLNKDKAAVIHQSDII